jgi:hypothetical protein
MYAGAVGAGDHRAGTRALGCARPVSQARNQFFEGPYFRQPLSDRSQEHQKVITDDPLYEPLQKIGVDEAGIRRLFKQFAREQIQKWIRITDAAINERPQAFPGFKTSPAAFLIDGIQNQRMPPDWIYAHEKEQQRRDWERQRQLQSAKESELRQVYESERADRRGVGRAHLPVLRPLAYPSSIQSVPRIVPSDLRSGSPLPPDHSEATFGSLRNFSDKFSDRDNSCQLPLLQVLD